MQLLARLLHKDDRIAAEIMHDEERLAAAMQAFFESYKEKQRVLQALLNGESVHVHLHTLERALREELAAIEESASREKEILSDLKYLSKEHYLGHLDGLLRELREAEEEDASAQHVLRELNETIEAEARKVHRLLMGEYDDAIRAELLDLLLIERHLVERLSFSGHLHELFRNLYRGTREHERLREVHERLQHRISEVVRNIEVRQGIAQSTDDHYLSELSARVFNRLDEEILDAISTGAIASHPEVDREFVNSPLFEHLVEEEIQNDQSTGKFVPSHKSLEIFVAAFREMYNGAMQ